MAAKRHSEDGFTVIEITLVSSILLIVVAMLLPLIRGSLNTFTNTQVRSDAVDNIQLALGQVGHDVVSANLMYLDASQIVHMETFSSNGTSTCVEYQVAYPASPAAQIGTMQRRKKTPGSSAWTGAWTNVMTGVVNSTHTGNPAVFQIQPNSQNQSLTVNMWVQTDTRKNNAAAPENYGSTFTGSAIPANVPQPTGAQLSTEPC
jgi:type II secretory pathway pseudopilin PulG